MSLFLLMFSAHFQLFANPQHAGQVLAHHGQITTLPAARPPCLRNSSDVVLIGLKHVLQHMALQTEMIQVKTRIAKQLITNSFSCGPGSVANREKGQKGRAGMTAQNCHAK